MNPNPIRLLEQKLSSNQVEIARLESLINDAYSTIERTNKQKNALDQENLSIKYCLKLVQPADENADAAKVEEIIPSKISLRATVLELFSTDQSMTVTEVYEKTQLLSISATKATINATLHAMTKKRILQKVSLGLYRKVG